MCRSSHSEVFLKILQNSKENTCNRVSFLIKNTFFMEHLQWLLLNVAVCECLTCSKANEPSRLWINKYLPNIHLIKQTLEIVNHFTVVKCLFTLLSKIDDFKLYITRFWWHYSVYYIFTYSSYLATLWLISAHARYLSCNLMRSFNRQIFTKTWCEQVVTNTSGIKIYQIKNEKRLNLQCGIV